MRCLRFVLASHTSAGACADPATAPTNQPCNGNASEISYDPESSTAYTEAYVPAHPARQLILLGCSTQSPMAPRSDEKIRCGHSRKDRSQMTRHLIPWFQTKGVASQRHAEIKIVPSTSHTYRHRSLQANTYTHRQAGKATRRGAPSPLQSLCPR